jgi:hypothetical protein
MSLPTDFHREIAERAEPPGFDVVLDRARSGRRRRRTTIAAGLAAACVVGGTALVVGGPPDPDDRTPEPAPPGLIKDWDGTSEVDPRLPGSVRVVLENERLDLWAVSASGGVAALWRGCDVEPCTFVVVIRDGDNVVGATLGASVPRISPVPGGWLYEDTRGFSLLNPAGGHEPILVSDSPATDVMAGDTAVQTYDGVRLLRGSKLIAVPTPSGRPATAAYVTPDGRMVAATEAGAGAVFVAATDDGRSWDTGLSTHTGLPVTGVMIAGHGDHVAVALLGDDPDGSVPVLEVQVSHDAGRTWTWARDLDTDGGDKVRDASSLAVTADGLAFLATGSHHVVRVDAEGDVLPIQLSSFDSSVFELAGAVCAVSERGRWDQLSCSTDGGTNWSAQPLPGLQ